MAQHDYDIANQTGAQFRTDLNNLLDAIVSLNSGPSAPTTTFAFMFWMDTTTGLLKIRNSGDTAWVTVGDPAEENLDISAPIATSSVEGIVLLHRDHIGGCRLLPDGTTELQVSAGQVVDDANTVMFNIAALGKTGGSWAVGDGNGGLDTGVIAAGFYSVYGIHRSDTNVSDILLSLNATSPSMPTNYDSKRHLGFVEVDGSDQFIEHIQHENFTQRKTAATPLTSSSGTATLRTLNGVPTGKKLRVKLNVYVQENDAGIAGVSHWDPALGSTNPTGDNGRVRHHSSATVGGHSTEIEVITDTSARIYNQSTGTIGSYSAEVIGWYYDRKEQ